MGYRYYLCGTMRLSKSAWERAQKTPFLTMCFVDDNFDVTMQGVDAARLFSASDQYQQWAVNSYDEKTQRWVFGCSLHDDDWDNAEVAPLPRALKKVKDLPGTDLVLVAHDWQWDVARAWQVEVGKVIELKQLPKLEGATSKQLFAGNYEKALASLSEQLALDRIPPKKAPSRRK